MTKASELYGGRDPADVPAYTLPEAAAMLGVHPSTLRAWVRGRKYPAGGAERTSPPVIHAPKGSTFLSFTNVVEAHVLAAMRRRYKLDLDTIRRAVKWVSKTMGVEHPLARVQFKTDKLDLFVEHLGHLISASEEGQIAIREVLDTYLERVDYEQGRAARFFPLYREDAPRVIVVDPRRAFGRPIVAGTSVPIVDIRSRFEHGDSVRDLARDFRVRPEAIEEALRAATAAA